MRNVILLTLYILIGNISGTTLYANNSIKLHASHISINKGMHQSTIHAMYQDEFGMIWFGTKRGLVRYDGTQMKFIQKLYNDIPDAEELVRSITGDQNGNIYIETRSGIIEYNIKKDHFRKITPYSQCMYYSDSCLWIGYKNTIYQWKNNILKLHLQLPKESCIIDCITETSKGNLYIGTRDDGIFLIRRNKDTKQMLANINQIRQLYIDSEQKIWVATRRNGLFLIDSDENIKNFNELPIQYRAVTTDLQTGKEVVLRDGDLALATFKSMAIPSFLEPVEDNGKFYVDGGVVNNFPIDVALSLGADIIIAVDISAEASKINEKSNLITILDKLATYNGNRKVELHKRLADILIVPDVKDHDTIDFSNLSGLVDEGEKAAEKYGYILENLSYPEEFKKIKEKSLKEKPILIKNIKLVGNEILTEKKVKNLMPNVNNKQFSRADLNDWTKRIYSVSYIERAFYEIDGDTIIFKVKEKDGININASLNYASNYGGSMNISATIPNFGLWTRNYTIKAEASSYPKIALNNLSFYELGRIKILTAASIGYEVDPLFIFNDGNKVSTYDSNTFKTTLSLGTAISNNVVTGLTLGYQDTDNKYSSGSRAYRDFHESYQTVSTGIYLYIDTLNKKNFPSKGNVLRFEGFNTQGITGKDINYNGFMFSSDFYLPVTEKFSMNLGISGGKTAGENIPNSSLFKLGGLRDNDLSFSFIGLPMMGRYTDEFYMIRSGIQYRLTDTFYLVGKYNMMTYSSDRLSFQKSYDIGDRRYHGYGGGIGWDTFLGPISLMVSNDLDSSSPLFEIYMGYTF